MAAENNGSLGSLNACNKPQLRPETNRLTNYTLLADAARRFSC